MKWMLVVMLFGATPIETGLMYDNLEACYRAEDIIRAENAHVFNVWYEGTQKIPRTQAIQRGQIYKVTDG